MGFEARAASPGAAWAPFGRPLGELPPLSRLPAVPSTAATIASDPEDVATSLSPAGGHDRRMTDSTRPAAVIAVLSEQGSDLVLDRAVELARERGSDLILWDADAGKRLLEDPLPNQWSAHGEEEQFGDRLTVNDLEAAGRAPLARRVADVQSRGVETWAWLPSSQDAEELRAYASRQGARTVVLAGDSDLRADLEAGGLRVEVVTAGARTR